MIPMPVPDDAQCLGCGYLLRGLSTHACPECGRAFNPYDPGTYRVPIPRWGLGPWSPPLWAGIIAGEIGLCALGYFAVISPECDYDGHGGAGLFIAAGPCIFFLGAILGTAAFRTWGRIRANPAGPGAAFVHELEAGCALLAFLPGLVITATPWPKPYELYLLIPWLTFLVAAYFLWRGPKKSKVR